jgi:hypothetical protein
VGAPLPILVLGRTLHTDLGQRRRTQRRICCAGAHGIQPSEQRINRSSGLPAQCFPAFCDDDNDIVIFLFVAAALSPPTSFTYSPCLIVSLVHASICSFHDASTSDKSLLMKCNR